MRKSLLVLCSLFALSIFAPAVAQAAPPPPPVDFVLTRNGGAPVGPNNNAVHGILTLVGGAQVCDTLENNDHLVQAGGPYPIVLSHSHGFGDNVPEIRIPGREGIRIHAGNSTHDTTCSILPGQGAGPDNIINSREALANIVDLILADQRNNIGSTILIQ